MRDDETLSWQAHPPKGSLPSIIYALGVALISFIGTVHDDRTRSWTVRTRAGHRLSRIMQQILALVARMHPNKVGQAAFNRLRPKPETPRPNQPTPQTPARPKTPRRRFTLLSARQVAARLATLLREFELAAIEAGHRIPQEIHDLFTQARTAAGCQALPPRPAQPKPEPKPNPNPKPGLFAEPITLSPWHPLLC